MCLYSLFRSELNLASQKQGLKEFQSAIMVCSVFWVVLGLGSDVIDHFWSSADQTHLEINDQNSYHCNLQFISFQKIYTYMGLMTIVNISIGN